MKFTINRSLFIEKLNNVMRAISSRATIPILSGIKIELSEEELILTGSDSDISIRVKIPVSGNEDIEFISGGAIVLSARFFSEIVKKLPGKEFSFEVKEGRQVQIISDNSEFTVNGLDATSYPHLAEIGDDSSFNISGKTLREIINETEFAVSNQESRPILTGVNFTFEPDRIKAVATDSHRLSQRIISLENGSKNTFSLILPGKSLQELSHIIGETDPDITVCLGDNQVKFEIDDLIFYTRLLSGTYPDTDRLLPTQSTTSAQFVIRDLLSALDRASLLTHASRNNVVKMNLDVDNQKVSMSGDSPEIGKVEEEVPFSNLTGASLDIAFNPDYLRDALRASITDNVVMNFTQPLRPFTVVPDKEDVKFVQLITPVRTF